MGTLLEKSFLKDSDNALRQIHELVKDSNDRLAFNGINFSERYAKDYSKVSIALKLRSLGEGKNYNLFVKAIPFGDADIMSAGGKPSQLNFPDDGNWSLTTQCYRDQGIVFVDKTAFMESPQEIISSFVWFQPVNHGGCFWRQALYFFLRLGQFEMCFVPPYGKMEGASIGNTVKGGESTDQMVKSRTQVMNNLSNNNCNFPALAFRHLDLEAFLRGVLVVHLTGNDIGVSIRPIEEGVIPLYEIEDVGIGSFNL